APCNRHRGPARARVVCRPSNYGRLDNHRAHKPAPAQKRALTHGHHLGRPRRTGDDAHLGRVRRCLVLGIYCHLGHPHGYRLGRLGIGNGRRGSAWWVWSRARHGYCNPAGKCVHGDWEDWRWCCAVGLGVEWSIGQGAAGWCCGGCRWCFWVLRRVRERVEVRCET
ncbi:hypothetical protein M427DRAFT_143844, partial [Gonapodya prolifera JEL478]